MSDIAGRMMFPGELESIDEKIRAGFVSRIRELSKNILSMESGAAATIIAETFLAVGAVGECVTSLTNEKASNLASSVADLIESDPSDKYIAGVLMEDGVLAAIVFDVTDGSSHFFKLSENVPRGTVAGDIFASLIIENAMKKLSRDNNAAICWGLVEHFCGISLEHSDVNPLS